MAVKDNATLAADLLAKITTNANEEITGAVLYGYLKDLLDSIPTLLDYTNYIRQTEVGSNKTIIAPTFSRVITFDNVIGTLGKSYALAISCYDVSGNNVDYTITSRTNAGFTITAAAACEMDYIAIKL